MSDETPQVMTPSDALRTLVLDLSLMAQDIPAIRKHRLFRKWFNGLPNMALYEQVLNHDAATGKTP